MTITTSAPVRPGEATDRTWAFRPHLEGLRGVAVILVIAFHAGLGFAPVGYVGVDVFFVLSGFLVTGVLLRERPWSTKGGYWRFYARRSARLLPAAAIAVLATAIMARFLADPVARLRIQEDILGIALYAGNWTFLGRGLGYFGTASDPSPLLHYWSLGVEEQFYVMWPLLLSILVGAATSVRRGRSAGFWIATVTLGGATLLFAASHPVEAFFATPFRAFELVAGASIAVGSAQIGRRVSSIVAVAATASLLPLTTGVLTNVPSVAAAIATLITVALIISLEGSPGGTIGQILGSMTLRFLGRISYGMYLWHVAILWVITPEELAGIWRFAIAMIGSTGLGWASERLVERPIRTSVIVRRRPGASLVGLVSSGLVVCGLAYLVATPPGDADAPWRVALSQRVQPHDCVGVDFTACVEAVGGAGTVLLVGDSHAAQWVPAIRAIAERRDLTFVSSTVGWCAWNDVDVQTAQGDVHEQCPVFRQDVAGRLIPSLHPDLVIFSSGGIYSRPVLEGDRWVDPGTEAHTTAVVSGGRRTIDAVDGFDDGIDVVVLGPLPVAPQSIPVCLATAEAVTDCAFPRSVGMTPARSDIDAGLRSVDGIRVVDVAALVCPGGVCRAMVGDIVTRPDAEHLTSTFSMQLSAALECAVWTCDPPQSGYPSNGGYPTDESG